MSGRDAFVTKLNPAGASLVYSTLIGGSMNDAANAVALDGLGNAYVFGGAYSEDFPTTPGAFDSTPDGNVNSLDLFVAELNRVGSDVRYSTYLGGSDHELASGLGMDSKRVGKSGENVPPAM